MHHLADKADYPEVLLKMSACLHRGANKLALGRKKFPAVTSESYAD